jgi:hypothetical protein
MRTGHHVMGNNSLDLCIIRATMAHNTPVETVEFFCINSTVRLATVAWVRFKKLQSLDVSASIGYWSFVAEICNCQFLYI